MEEKLFSFLPDQFPNPEAFFVELTGVTYPDPHYRIDRDRSPVLCLEYVISGQGSVNIGGPSFYPKAGDVYLLPMGLHHRYRSDPHNPWQKIWMNVRGTLCADLLARTILGKRTTFPLAPFLGSFRNLFPYVPLPLPTPGSWIAGAHCCSTNFFHGYGLLYRVSRKPLPAPQSKPGICWTESYTSPFP